MEPLTPGDFTLSSAWETTRSQRPVIPELEDIWNVGLTTSMSIFVWRLLSNRVPVDTKLQWRNISLASKCQCCPRRPGIESLQHLFIQGYGASRVWREFDVWFEGGAEPLRLGDTIPDRLEKWAKRTQQSSKKHLSRVIPCLILWFLWSERNKCRHNDVQFRPQSVIWQVQMHIRNHICNGRIGPKQWKGTNMPIPLPSQTEARRNAQWVMAIKWNPPDPPWIKLNTNGSFVAATGRASGGGIVRDHQGQLLTAFTTPLPAHSDLEAELRAILQGLLLAMEFGNHIWLESDASQAIALINAGNFGPAHSRHIMVRIRLIQKECRTRFTFTHREGNKAADFLAKMSPEAPSFKRLDGHSIPRLLKAIIRLEQLGVPNIRVNDNTGQ